MKPINMQYFRSLRVKSFNIFFVPIANIRSKMKHTTYLKNIGAATY